MFQPMAQEMAPACFRTQGFGRLSAQNCSGFDEGGCGKQCRRLNQHAEDKLDDVGETWIHFPKKWITSKIIVLD